MRKLTLYCIAIIFAWILLAQCIILRNRWSDEKANRIFAHKNVPLSIRDTIINNRHLHYALTGSDTLPTLVFIHGSPGSWMNYARYMWDASLLKKFRMVSIDRPCFGYSNFGKPLPLQLQCAIILTALRSLKKVKPIFLYGHSMGGPIVVQLAAEAPELFET